MNSTGKMVRFGLLLALAVLLHYIESLFPLDSVMPGVKLGLANSVGMLVLCFYGWRDYITFGLLRVLLVALLSSGLFSVAFFLSLSGVLLSSLMTILVYKFSKCSILGLSIVGSLFHGLGQVLMVCVIYENVYMMSYLPFLLSANFVMGIILAKIVASILKRLPESVYRKYNRDNEVNV